MISLCGDPLSRTLALTGLASLGKSFNSGIHAEVSKKRNKSLALNFLSLQSKRLVKIKNLGEGTLNDQIILIIHWKLPCQLI